VHSLECFSAWEKFLEEVFSSSFNTIEIEGWIMSGVVRGKFDLVLIRGLPGSGKTTLAKIFESNGYRHFEADQFFEVRGKYLYDPRKVKAAHVWCAKIAERAIGKGQQVVVSNTFIKIISMRLYLALAKNPLIISATGTWQNVHGVTDQAVVKMAAEWEDFAGPQQAVNFPDSAAQAPSEWVSAVLSAP
jgi:predicted kinase